MQIRIDNFSTFINNYIKVMARFFKDVKSPGIKIKVTKGYSCLFLTDNSRKLCLFFPCKVEKTGECLIPCDALLSVKAKSKETIITLEGEKLYIVSQGKGKRTLSMVIPCLNAEKFIDFNPDKSISNEYESLNLSDLQKAFYLNVKPVIAPGETSAIGLLRNKKYTAALIYDSSRVFYVNPKLPLITENIVTDYNSMLDIITLLKNTSDNVKFYFTRNKLYAVGRKKQALTTILEVHHISKGNKLDAAETILDIGQKGEPIIAFKTNSEFNSMLSNILYSVKGKTAAGAMSSFIDIVAKENSLYISSENRYGSFQESITMEIEGEGSVRVGSNMLEDIAEHIPEGSLFRVTSKLIHIANADTVVIIPFISLKSDKL